MEEIPEFLRSHYEDPYHRGPCERATHVSQSHEPDSQHFILMQLRVSDEGIVDEAWFDSQGCMYCEAPASILVQYCESKSIDELTAVDALSYLTLTQLDQVSTPPSCHMLAWAAFQAAIRSTGIDFEGGPTFGGPSLGEES